MDLEHKNLFCHPTPCNFAGRNKTYNHTSNMKQNLEQTGEIVMYQPDETIRLEVRMDNETVWLNRQQMASLFGRDVKTIGKHINNALKEELRNLATVAKFAIVQPEGKRMISRLVEFYNLDMVLSVGYRVKSQKGILFRQWANGVLKEYMLRGYAVNKRMELLEDRFLRPHIFTTRRGYLLRRTDIRCLPFRVGLNQEGKEIGGVDRQLRR